MDITQHLRIMFELVAILLCVGLFLVFFGEPICQLVSSVRKYASFAAENFIPLAAAVFGGPLLAATIAVPAILLFFGIPWYVLIGVPVVVSSLFIWRNRVRILSFVKNKTIWLWNRARYYWYNISRNQNHNRNKVLN